MIARNVIDRRDLNGSFDEIKCDAVRRVSLVNDVAGYDDHVGMLIFDLLQEYSLVHTEELVMKV